MTKAEIMFLERVHAGAVSFTYEPDPNGGKHARLVHSTVSGAQQPKYHALAVQGLLAEKVTGEPHKARTTVSFTLTASGREVLGVHAPAPRPVHWSPPISEEELAKDAIE